MKKIFLIISDDFVQQIVMSVSEASQINSVYIISNDITQELNWKEQCGKIKGTSDTVENIFHILKHDIYLAERDLSPLTTISSTSITDLNELD
ncbi:unnamed protein product [Adineta ricciae]|uniref:Uncharacterized protein n=2 Tax=Adineta ricciae TaxID=249248 RepID=A0A814MM58_ADIRI|nr:unnamed protein product [Adineta ricciae]